MKRNTYVIGDIHGALRALEQLLSRVAPTRGDRLIFLGDYVDGWSQSAQVIAYLMELRKEYDCVFIKGNHDAWCEQWLMSGMPDEHWLANSGDTTVASYAFTSPEEKSLHRDFMGQAKYYIADKADRLFIHAGFTSMHGPHREQYGTNYYWDRTLWELALSLDMSLQPDSPFFPKRLKHFKEIFIGHTPTTGYDVMIPMNRANVWNVDTGAGFHGKLTAMNIDTKEYWQSDLCPSLYPDEKGRN